LHFSAFSFASLTKTLLKYSRKAEPAFPNQSSRQLAFPIFLSAMFFHKFFLLLPAERLFLLFALFIPSSRLTYYAFSVKSFWERRQKE